MNYNIAVPRVKIEVYRLRTYYLIKSDELKKTAVPPVLNLCHKILHPSCFSSLHCHISTGPEILPILVSSPLCSLNLPKFHRSMEALLDGNFNL